MPRRLPDFAIIGAQKAASTHLLMTLREHPQVWMPGSEEPFFRDPVFDVGALDVFTAKYADRPERRLGLKCPDYLARPEVPARLRQYLGSPQLIACLRNPVDRALSAYYWRMRWGVIPIAPPEEGLNRILDGGYRDIDPSVGEILEWGLYHQHLRRYLQLFARDDILVLVDEDLRRAPEEAIATTYRFLGLDPVPAPVARRRPRNEGVYSLPRLAFLQRRNKYLLRWDEHSTYPTIGEPDRALAKLYSKGVAGVDRYVLARRYPNLKPELSDSLRARLNDYYSDDSAQLRALLARALPGWPGETPKQSPTMQ